VSDVSEEFAYRRRDIDALLDALDEAVELVKECNHEYRIAEDGRRQLQRQCDSAVAILQKAQTPVLPVGAYSLLALSWRDAIDTALAALGAEEMT
jgi:RNAse (barnase) inhibitor barstar